MLDNGHYSILLWGLETSYPAFPVSLKYVPTPDSMDSNSWRLHVHPITHLEVQPNPSFFNIFSVVQHHSIYFLSWASTWALHGHHWYGFERLLEGEVYGWRLLRGIEKEWNRGREKKRDRERESYGDVVCRFTEEEGVEWVISLVLESRKRKWMPKMKFLRCVWLREVFWREKINFEFF